MSELEKISSFRANLAIAETIEEIQLLRDAGEVCQELQKKRKIAKSKIDEIGDFIIEAEEKEAEWLNQYFPHGAKPGEGFSRHKLPNQNLMPVPPKESARARKLKRTKEENPEFYNKIKQEIKDSEDNLNPKSLYKELRKQENIDNRTKIREKYDTELELKVEKKYRIIYADPPWKYDKGKELSDKYGDVQKHYPPMEIEDICNLPVSDLAYPDCVLFLWATAPKLPEALKVMESWGFQYKTNIVWDKIKHNFGFYFSIRHELLLIGGIGKSTPDLKELFDSVISIERSDKHSEKPECFRQLIDKLYITGNRIELFSRGKLPENWDKWGNDCGL